MPRIHASLLLVVALTIVVPELGVAAPAPDASCRSAKLKGSGKYAATVLKCAAKAAKTGVAPDSACLAKGSSKFTDAFAKAESKTGVDCNGLDETSRNVVDEAAADVDAAAPVPPGGGDCAARVRQASGKFASSVLGAWSKFAKAPDAAKRDAAIGNARTKLADMVAKAETRDGCTSAGQAEAVRVAVEVGIETLIGCLASTVPCVESAEEVAAGGTSTTDPGASGPSGTTPVVAAVQTPNAGTVVLRVIDEVSTPPGGYNVLGREVDITAPDATAADPLVLTFVIHASLLPPDPNTVAITRNGVFVPNCTGAPGVADPDPCIQSRTVLGGGDLQIVALTSHASLWTPLVPIDPATGCPTILLLETRADDGVTDVATEIDVGWKGAGHDIDPVSGSAMTFALDCSGGTPGNCGSCAITGFDASSGNCRCQNDPRIVCDEPQAADADDCGGSQCQCYIRVPSPVSVYGTPACVYSRAGSDVTGAWDVEAGSGSFTLDERLLVHIGATSFGPCPTCDGDVAPGDGVRDGVCAGGQSSGLSCDAQASDPTWPIPGGGFYSLDCMPTTASNIAGSGLAITHTETTGTSTLASTLPCTDVPGDSCPCAVCSGNPSVACSSDAGCAALGALCAGAPSNGGVPCSDNADCASADVGPCIGGILKCSKNFGRSCTTNADCLGQNVGPCSPQTCSSIGYGVDTRQDACDSACNVDGSGEGECGLATVEFCDGYLDEDGHGILACSVNSDCQTFSPDAGNCTIVQPRDCFAATISATGLPDPATPRTVATMCVPPTSNGGVNTVFGLPGPGRVRNDWFATLVE